MTTNKLGKQRRLGYQALEARELMHGESIVSLPEVDVRQLYEPVLVASATPQHTFQELSQEAIAISTSFTGDQVQLDTLPPDTIDWSGVLPSLSSNPSAPATIYLDFNGHSEEVWGLHSDIEVPKFDIDHDLHGYSAAENLMIQNVWARVAEDFAPFNINVTTVDPGSFENGEALRIAIGGRWDDWWYTQSASGVAGTNAFTNDRPNVAFVWSETMDEWAEEGGKEARLAQWIADTAAHEAGHSFGLGHQSTYRTRNGITFKSDEYRTGDSWKGPTMGSTFYSDRSVWSYGKTGPAAQVSYQDDMAIIAGTNNGFGYRSDDHGDTLRDATVLAWDTTNVSGIIEQTEDVDVFRFDTSGGQITIDLDVARLGANLDARIELWGSAPPVFTRSLSTLSKDSAKILESPSLLASSDPADALDGSITMNVAAGTYYVKVLSHGEYGDVGQYTLGGELNLKHVIQDPVNGADFLAWQRGYGTVDARRTDGDADDDLDVDSDDLALWLSQYGQTEPVIAAVSSPIVESVVEAEPTATLQVDVTTASDSAPKESVVGRFPANLMSGPSDVSLGVSSIATRQEPLETRAFTELSDERFYSTWHSLPAQNRDSTSDDFANARHGHSTKGLQPVDEAFSLLADDEGSDFYWRDAGPTGESFQITN